MKETFGYKERFFHCSAFMPDKLYMLTEHLMKETFLPLSEFLLSEFDCIYIQELYICVRILYRLDRVIGVLAVLYSFVITFYNSFY